jgi:uncharacterized protein YkwD
LSSPEIHGKVGGGERAILDKIPVLPQLYFGKRTMLKSGKRAVTLALGLTFLWCLSPAWGQLRVIKPPRRGRGPIQHLRAVENRIFQLTNMERRKKHLPPLDKDPTLVKTARAHSDDMLERNFFSHVNPDGMAPQNRIVPAYAGAIARTGENIWGGHGHDYSDSKLMARVIVDSWMISPGHRANILNPKFTHMGVGVSALGKEVRATENFVQR